MHGASPAPVRARAARLPENELPVADVDPAIELESDFVEVRDFPEAKLLMQTHTRCIRQRDSTDHDVNAMRSQAAQQRSV